MTLPSWWQVTMPHKDIREGKLSEAIFAADLGDVVYGKAPIEYQDASIFFQKTYLTKGLKNLLENVLSRVGQASSLSKGDPVIQLQKYIVKANRAEKVEKITQGQTGIATSVFLYSFSAGASKETTLPRIRVALLREGIPATIVGDAIAKLEEELWFFHSEKKQYAFRNQPNMNSVIVDREETVSDERIREELKNLIQKNAGRALEIYLWPDAPLDIPDNKNLKLAILSPDFSYKGTGETPILPAEIFEMAGIGFRVYKNTLFILLIDSNQYVSLSKAVRRILALMEVQNDKSLLETLSKQSQEELKKKFKETEKEMPFKTLTAYRYLAMLEENGMNWKDSGIPTTGSEQTISERVKDYHRDQSRF